MREQSTDSVEEWHPVVHYEGVYEVSDLGRVRNVARRAGTRQGFILTPRLPNAGYLQVFLSKDGVKRHWSVHRLVLLAFDPMQEGQPHANHIDGDRLNNVRSNLEWVSQAQNVQHAIAIGLTTYSARRGESCAQAKLAAADVQAIRLLRGTATLAAIGARFGVTGQAIAEIFHGRTWRHLK